MAQIIVIKMLDFQQRQIAAKISLAAETQEIDVNGSRNETRIPLLGYARRRTLPKIVWRLVDCARYQNQYHQSRLELDLQLDTEKISKLK